MQTVPYDRDAAVAYARRWAYDRNPLFTDFAGIGGDCTNFVSQCLFASCCAMNFTPVYGWYYIDSVRRTAAWTGVEFFYRFLTENEGIGPFAEPIEKSEVAIGDVIQIAKVTEWSHTMIVTGKEDGELLVAAHSYDAFDRPLSTYEYENVRYLRILGARIDREVVCFHSLLRGETLII